MAQDGFDVILNDLESKYDIGQAAAKNISASTGQRVIFMGGDVSSEQDVDALVERAVHEFGGLDVVSIIFYPVWMVVDGLTCGTDDCKCRGVHRQLFDG
jgi:NAD(P)-dependent dehydrogenase (short-subunit alcohol dehydrogenase family)